MVYTHAREQDGPEIFDHVREHYDALHIGKSNLTDIPGDWPTTVALFRSNIGHGSRFLKNVFEVFIPTRTIQLYEISGGLQRTRFSYQRGMVGFNPPGADWSIEWEGVIEGVCFYFDEQTVDRAVQEIFGESPDQMIWRLALSDHAPAIAYLGLDIASQAANGFPIGQQHVDDLMRAFLSLAIRRYSKSDLRNSARVGILSPQVLRAIKFIDENLTSALSIELICDHSAASIPHLNRLFRKEVGQSVWNYVIRQRLNVAAAELTRCQTDLETIAKSAGFRSKANFAKHFKQRFGQTPAAYRHRR